ncbi:hypothetical protein Hdeb2414_s0032g00712201 [Helianthus debilis subsp. tardiflorus]
MGTTSNCFLKSRDGSLTFWGRRPFNFIFFPTNRLYTLTRGRGCSKFPMGITLLLNNKSVKDQLIQFRDANQDLEA